jgi:hypothetical protein
MSLKCIKIPVTVVTTTITPKEPYTTFVVLDINTKYNVIKLFSFH